MLSDREPDQTRPEKGRPTGAELPVPTPGIQQPKQKEEGFQMPSRYPDEIDEFTTKIDGVSIVAAGDINDLQDAVVAIETALGPNPQPQISFNEDVNHIFFKDDFMGARNPGWTLAGSGTYTQNSEFGGTGTLTTGSTSDDEAFLRFDGKGFVQAGHWCEAVTRARLEDLTEVHAVLLGLYQDPDNLIEVYYEAASTPGNFKFRCRSGGVETSEDSNVAADTEDHVFRLHLEPWGPGVVRFNIDFNHEGEVFIEDNIPSGLLEPNVGLATRENAAKELTVDLFLLKGHR